MEGLYATEYIFYAPLTTTGSQDYKSNPTIAAGDFQVSTDGSAWTNLDTLPSLSPAADIQVKITVSIAEMTGKKVTIRAIDAAGAEWEDDFWEIDTYGHASAQHPYRDAGFSIANVLDVVESQRGAHTWGNAGQILYVDPANGDTIANGRDGSRDLPLDTVTEALSLVVDSSHSIIFLVPGAAGGATTLTEAVTVNKRYTFIRGSGRDFIWTRSGAGDTITVTADGCELTGFQINTAASGSGAGVVVNNADFTRMNRLWINDTRGDGIDIQQSTNCVVESCHFDSSGQSGAGHGLVLDPTSGTVSNTRIEGNHFADVAGDAIRVASGGTVDDTMIVNNEIHGSTGWAVNLQAGTNAFVVCNRWGDNTSGDLSDSGTNTVAYNNNAWAEAGDAMDLVADAVDAAAIATDAIDADAIAADAGVEIAAAVDVDLSATHGAGSWLANTTAGARTITITVNDAVAAAVVGCIVDVYDSLNTTWLGRYTTNGSGVVTPNLDDATYSIRLSKVRFTPDNNPETLVVTADASVTYTGTVVPTSTSASPNLCTVSGYLIDSIGATRDGEVIRFLGDGITSQDTNQVTAHSNSVTTGAGAWAAGYFEIDLVRGTTIRVACESVNNVNDKVITIPDAGAADFTTLIAAAP